MRKIALAISLGLLLCSCEHKDLCFDHESHAWQSAIEVTAEYELEWEYPLVPREEWSYDIPYNSLRPETPEGLRAMVYSTAYPSALTNLPPYGGVVRVPVGLSDILFQNNDTEGIVFDNLDNIASAQASTRLKTRPGYSGVQVRDATVGEPDVLFAASLTGHRGVSQGEPVPVRVTMTPFGVHLLYPMRVQRGRRAYSADARGARGNGARRVSDYRPHDSGDMQRLVRGRAYPVWRAGPGTLIRRAGPS